MADVPAPEGAAALEAPLLARGLASPDALARRADFPSRPVEGLGLRDRFLVEHRVLPLAADERRVVVAMADPLDGYARHAIGLATGRAVEVRVAVPAELEPALRALHGPGDAGPAPADQGPAHAGGSDDEDVERLRDLASDAPVVRLVNALLARAADARASDLHLEPEGAAGLRVRYRVDGRLEEADTVPAALAAGVVSRVKVMAGLDIAERRLPQDGRLALTARGRRVDVRVSTVPFHPAGEGAVLRLLDRDAVALDLGALGLAGEGRLARLRGMLREPNGIALVTGPTGSGKTSTLYAALLELRRPEAKIVTVEDPAEHRPPRPLNAAQRRRRGLGRAAARRGGRGPTVRPTAPPAAP